MIQNDYINKKAMECVLKWERQRLTKNYSPNPLFVKDISNNKTVLKGFDVLSYGFKNIKKNDIKTLVEEYRTIEVKGTTKGEECQINLHETEITPDKKLVASHLYIVEFKKNKDGKSISYDDPKNQPIIHVIEKKEIKPEHLEEVLGYKLKNEFIRNIMSRSRPESQNALFKLY